MLQGLHRLVVHQSKILSDAALKCFSTTIVTEKTTRVNPVAYTPAPLEENIEQLELLLADETVRKDEKLWNTNQSSLTTLKFFLKRYTETLRKEDTEFLPQQRHMLEFILRDEAHETGLRRVVCHLGTTGGDSHRLVTRALQGLFKEVGLSPNFLWDKTYKVREEHLTREQRDQLEDARLEAIKDQIVAHQQGQKDLPDDSPLKVADPDEPFPFVGSGAHMSVDDDDDDEDEDMDEEEARRQDRLRIQELEHICTQLAMKPWVEVHSAALKEVEERTAEEMFFHLLQAGCHLREPTERIWGGERNAEALITQFFDTPGDGAFVPKEMLLQLLECTKALERTYGRPSAAAPVPIKSLMTAVKPICIITSAFDEDEGFESGDEVQGDASKQDAMAHVDGADAEDGAASSPVEGNGSPHGGSAVVDDGRDEKQKKSSTGE